jgi:dCTP deaminase
LIADGQAHYDQIDPPFDKKLFVEVTPITFPISVAPGDPICQLRLFKGHPSQSRIHPNDLSIYCKPILLERNAEELRVSTKIADVPKAKRASAMMAKEAGALPEKPIPLGGKGESIPPEDYWELVTAEEDGTIQIKQDRFYILRSVERFRLPSDVAVYAKAMNEAIGEMRIHYAGFVHPHFGEAREDGTPLIFEVRGHNINVILRQDEILAQLQYFQMSEPAEPGDNTYDKQELKLAKYFASWK